MGNEKINGLIGDNFTIKEQPTIATQKYVDEKVAISEHNYHILRGDFNEHIRNYKKEKIDNFKTFADIYERLVNIMGYIKLSLSMVIATHIILFIFVVVYLWKRF